ncbi:ubiquinone biosynthesis methyltransferase UbiE [Amycolatopsis orientalis]|uniref:Ubiquinone biosynthesis methyltransferase UbiE n=1 Tax=Amycolatopsis orientalis TaxID=31958 RepID=A0A193C0A9_AMYOR|nr:class I SAM-dependent methyltransferase [Amycolatopsis orientalis]ANN17838.1 ubiquinone biosynthesis methyltransferase UbiE [Amycolatopsis orientalis]
MTRPARWNRYWDGKSRNYDREMRFLDRKLFGDSRTWACGRAEGEVLEVAVGTGLNLPLYPEDVTLTGIDLSDGMLAIARDRAERLGHPATLRRADAHDLPFDAGSFDTVVCTLGLCAIPDDGKALREMGRVLRSGGRLILLDHIASSSRAVRGLQWLTEKVTVPMAGEHFLRRPSEKIDALGLTVESRERFKLGLVERLVARK